MAGTSLSLRELNPPYRSKGIAAAGCILAAWGLAVAYAWLAHDWIEASPFVSLALLIVLVFLFTGLFITAHEAMHGLVAPSGPGLNRRVGQLAMFAFAGFSYDRFLPAHHEHHDFTASEKDPDFHDGKKRDPWRWFVKFMRTHITWRPFAIFGFFFVATWLAGGSLVGYLFAWPVPALLSAFQLFYFGTYLPHREPSEGYNSLKSRSNDYPEWLSLLTCYHFGYHFEHHSWPNVPWWRLPAVRNELVRTRK